MENLEAAGKQESLEDQYKIVKQKTNLSAVMQYGNMSFTNLPVGDFIGDTSPRFDVHKKHHDEHHKSTSVNSRDIPLHLSYYRYLRADATDFARRQQLAFELIAELSSRNYYDNLFMSLATEIADESIFHAKPQIPAVCGDCCDKVNKAMEEYCGGYDDYSLQYSRVVYNLCVSNGETEKIVEKLRELC